MEYPKYFENNIDGSVAKFINLTECILIKGSRKSFFFPHFPKGTHFTNVNHSDKNIWTRVSNKKIVNLIKV